MVVMSFLPMISSSTLELIIAGLIVITILNLILVIVTISMNNALRRKVRRRKSVHVSADLEAVYSQTIEAVNELRSEMKNFGNQIKIVQEKVHGKVDTPVIRRFNAFADTGSDLSYSVALLDGNKNGVVLTSIYARQDSHTYGKPVFKGASDYPLTDEEQAVIGESGNANHSDVHIG